MNISIIIPARNAAETLPAALRSLASEKEVILEILLVDDASNDKTAEVARSSAADLGLPLRVISANCGNAGAARNIALDSAQAEWIYFFDADDVHLTGGLRGLHAAAQVGADIAIGPYKRLTDNRWRKDKMPKRYASDPLENATRYLAGFHRTAAIGSLLIRRSAIGEHRFPVGLPFDEDTILWIKILLQGKVVKSRAATIVYLLDTERANRRFRLNSQCAFDTWSSAISDLEHLGLPRWAGDYRRGSVALKMARVHYASGNFNDARGFLTLAASYPHTVKHRIRLWRYKFKLMLRGANAKGEKTSLGEV